MRRGFTLLELMVASLLLAMLVTILTMMFNQSSIAWRTGIAGVSDLKDSRVALGTYHDIQDDILPGLGDDNPSAGAGDNRTVRYRTVSLWDKDRDNQLRKASQRAFSYENSSISWGMASAMGFTTVGDAMTGLSKGVPSGNASGGSLFTVGVRSAGPDRKFDTNDDITTWPEEIE